MTSLTTYTRFEVIRTLRNKQSFIFSLVFPILMYCLFAAPNKNVKNFGGVPGLRATQYYMVSLMAFGTMVAVLGGGARIAAERTVGWNRILRLTPLTPNAYIRTKILVGYLMAILTILLMYIAGISFGVRLSLGIWLTMTVLVLIALAPFAALGIGLGHLLNDDAVGPATGGGVSLMAFLGGSYFPITGGGWFPAVCKILPSYWLVRAGHVAYGGSRNAWGIEGWVVIGAWTVALVFFAAWAFRRDTGKR
jgi:ABC-2 type transport system permease protein